MRNPISYKFNPLADNALEALQEIVDDYMNEDFSHWGWTQNQERLKGGPEKALEWMLESCSKGGCQEYFVSLSHFNGTVFPSGASTPQSEDIRELSLFTPITEEQIRAQNISLEEDLDDEDNEDDFEPQHLKLVAKM